MGDLGHKMVLFFKPALNLTLYLVEERFSWSVNLKGGFKRDF